MAELLAAVIGSLVGAVIVIAILGSFYWRRDR